MQPAQSCDRCIIHSPLREKSASWALRAIPASELQPTARTRPPLDCESKSYGPARQLCRHDAAQQCVEKRIRACLFAVLVYR